MVGKVIGDKYEILEVVGGGGMGLIYKARHTLMKRIVAVKMMHAQYVSSSGNLMRFQLEAQAASALSHPNILTVYDFGLTPEGSPYLVMDFLEGTNLAEVLDEQGFLPPLRAAHIFAQAADALGHAHSKGVIHRDLKPGNIMLVANEKDADFVKIVDFGIAKLLLPQGESANLTKTGEVFGSPLYMSPEQCRGISADNRSDIYSLGCVMFRALSGSSPFVGQDPMQCMYKHVNELPPPIFDINPDSEVPAGLEAIVLKCLAKEPEARFQTMFELKEALDQFIAAPDTVPAGVQGARSDPAASVTTRPLPATTSAGDDVTSVMPAKVSDTLVPDTTGASAQAASAATASSGLEQASAAQTDRPPAATEKQVQNSAEHATKGSAPSESLALKKNPAQSEEQKIAILKVVIGLMLVAMVGFMVFAVFHDRKQESNQAQPSTGTISSGSSVDSYLDNAQKSIDLGLYGQAEDQITALFSNHADMPVDRRETALNLRADARRRQFKFTGAIEDYKAVLTLDKGAHHSKSAYAAHAYNGLGEVYTKQAKFAEAKKALDQASSIDRNFTGDSYIEVARTSFGLGNLMLTQGKLPEAVKYLSEAMRIISAAKGDNAPETACVYNALAQVYQYQRKFKEAEKLYAKAESIREREHSDTNTELADTLQCQGTLYFSQHQYAKAAEKLKRSLSLYEKVFAGQPNLIVATNDFCLGVLYQQQGKFAEAEPYYEKAFNTQKTVLGPSNPKTVKTATYYAAVLKKLNKADKAAAVLSGK